jgi:hypothetical protein
MRDAKAADGSELTVLDNRRSKLLRKGEHWQFVIFVCLLTAAIVFVILYVGAHPVSH